MFVKATSAGIKSVAALALGAALVVGNAEARVFDVKVAIHVSTQGIDVKQPAGAQELYRRIQHAAYAACTYGDRVDLKPADDVDKCHEEALGNAVRSVNAPLLTEVYLQTHTVQQAASYGIKVPRQLAAK